MDCPEITRRIKELKDKAKQVDTLLPTDQAGELFDLYKQTDRVAFETIIKSITERENRTEEEKYRDDIDHRDLIAGFFDYDNVGAFYQGVAFAEKRDEKGQWTRESFLLDQYGGVIRKFVDVECEYGFENGVCWIYVFDEEKDENRYEMINTKGETLANVGQLDYTNRHNGIFAVSDQKEEAGGEWYFLKNNGVRLSDKRYRDCVGFSGAVNKGWAQDKDFNLILIYEDGSERTIPGGIFDKNALGFGPDVSWVKMGTNDFNLFSGESDSFQNLTITTAEYVFPFSGGFGGYRSLTGDYNFRGKNTWLSLILDQIKPFGSSKDGMKVAAPVKIKSGGWELIDRLGNYLTDQEFDQISDFVEDLCWVQKGQEFYFLSLDGKEPDGLAGRRFASAGTFADGLAMVKDFDGIWHEMDKFGRYVFEKKQNKG